MAGCRVRIFDSDGVCAQLIKCRRFAWALLIANVFWAIAYDTEYAMVDRVGRSRAGLMSSAILLGRYDVRASWRAMPCFRC
jgi:4-hydroxybenzoate polyprenyltransferase